MAQRKDPGMSSTEMETAIHEINLNTRWRGHHRRYRGLVVRDTTTRWRGSVLRASIKWHCTSRGAQIRTSQY